MLKQNIFSFLLLIFIFFASCRTVQTIQVDQKQTGPNAVLNTSNYQTNCYIGVSGRMETREKEIYYTKLHIANQIAMRDKCVVDVGTINMEGRTNNIVLSDSNFDYTDIHIDKLMERVELIKTYIFPELVVSIGKDTEKSPEQNTYIPRETDERPMWIDKPELVRNLLGVDNYFVGIGVSEKYTVFYKGIIVADIMAAQSIAAEKKLYIKNYLYDFTDERTAFTETGNIVLTQAELEGFYILDRWIAPDMSHCYSLGIARKL